jgi:hypothetical protein
MRRRLWLFVLVLYAIAGVVDGAYHLSEAPAGHSRAGAIAVAFCAGLFWPIDLVARPLLMSR